ncbi:MAG: prepilin-type N-terminal cleavage/methylation domain-containing protein [Acidobacteria bacterium]|nr:prepilin-type N-terminal cleavage/methylation domain-containing protein [Acidobacteriota bacterium]
MMKPIEQMENHRESGFTLLELMIAALITVGLMGVIFSLINRNQQVFVSESGVTDMNENVRFAADLMTRDIQSAGMGLPRINGSFAAIFYTDGPSGAPDQLMILNGNPYAPIAEVTDRAAGSAEFFALQPPDVTVTGNGSNQVMTYKDPNGQSKPIYKDSATNPGQYIVYDDTKAMIFELTKDGQIVGSGGSARLKLQHNPTSYLNPPGIFGSVLDGGEPDYANAKISMLGSMIGYRVNQQTKELERTDDLKNWYSIARGILNLQIEYRVVNKNNSGALVETVSSAPTDRKNIRSVIVTITAETPDINSVTKSYRQVTHKFETAPRNFNLLNNTNLSSNTKGTWQF